MHGTVTAESGKLALTSSIKQRLSLFVFALFIILGSITSLNDVLIPKLKCLFNLSYTEAMLAPSNLSLA